MQSLGRLLAVLWCGAVGGAPVGSALQLTAAAADRSEASDEQWLRFEARIKALEASRAHSGSEDAVRAASAVGTALPAVAATAATQPAAVLPARSAVVATAPQTSEDVLRQAQTSLLSAISAAVTFSGQQPSRHDERSADPASTAAISAPTNLPTNSASSTLAATAAPPAAAVVATPTVQLQVTVPPGVAPGQQMLVQSPYGGQVALVVPAGVQPGQAILVHVPAIAANASAASDPKAGTLPASLSAVRPSTGADPTGLGAVALTPQCPPWLVPPSPHCASLLAREKTPTAAEPLAAATTAPPAASKLVEQTLSLDEEARRQRGRQRGVMQQLDASTAAIAASIASLAARDAPEPAIPTPQLPAASAASTATAEAQAEAALAVASDEIAEAQGELLALAKSLEPLTEYRATTDPVELRSALRELDKEWEEERAAEQRGQEEEAKAEQLRQEEAAKAEQRRQEWLRERREQAHAQAQATMPPPPPPPPPPPNCARAHWRDLNDWVRDPPRPARESDCKFICEQGSAKAWCVESKFSPEDNGSCSLFAASQEKTYTRMNNWSRDPPRAARESDCTFLCVEGSARAWCVESEFSTDDEGSCRLSSCKATPVERESGDRKREYLLVQARRRKRNVIAVLCFASPFLLFGLAWAYMPYRIMRLQDQLLHLGVKKAKKHSLCKV